MADPAFQAQSDAFLSWLTNSGVELSDKISLQDLRTSQAGRGLVATQDLPQDHTLFRIPRQLPLAVANSRLATQNPEILENDALDPWLSLILVLVYEFVNLESSPWKPYLDILPDSFDTLMFWSDSELAELQASSVVNKIGKEGADQSFREVLVPIIHGNSHVFFRSGGSALLNEDAILRLAHRAGSLIMAYAFDVAPADAVKPEDADEDGYVSEPEDQDLPKAMVPLADMLNADADLNNARLFHTPTHLEMKTIVPVAAGSQLYNDYGPLPSSDLLRRYGYLTERYAQYDVVEIPTDTLIEAARQTPEAKSMNFDERIRTLQDDLLLDSGYDLTRFPLDESVTTEPSGPETALSSLPEDIVEGIALMLASADELDKFVRKGKSPKAKNYASSIVAIVQQAAKQHLGRYSTTADQDQNLLGQAQSQAGFVNPSPATADSLSSPSPRRLRMAIMVRKGEKEILQDWIAFLARVKNGKRSRDETGGDDHRPQSGASQPNGSFKRTK